MSEPPVRKSTGERGQGGQGGQTGEGGHSGPTATQRVYVAIHAAIVEHRLAPGARLREAELAAGFAVSRTVVRQALQRLAADQVVELQHNRGAMVPQPSREQAAHVFDARRVVEGEVARRLAGRLGEAERAALRDIIEQETHADARGDRAAAIRLSGEFHRALARLSGNPLFLRFLDDLLPTTSLLIALYQPGTQRACAAHRHTELLAALAGGGAGAAAEMRRHLLEIERSLSVRDAAPQASLRDLFAPYREAV
jgi:DNA-binding GntR family transcriptional regulator